MITIYEDTSLSFRVVWDQICSFTVLQEYTDGASIEVDTFDIQSSQPMTMYDASQTAKEYCDAVRAEFKTA